jgi:hypothetical protein
LALCQTKGLGEPSANEEQCSFVGRPAHEKETQIECVATMPSSA